MMGHDERGRGASLAASLARYSAQLLAVQVIKVRMGYEDDIHGR